MIYYILKRLLSVFFTFIAVSLIVFIMMHSIPGGPFDPVDMPLSKAAKDTIMKQYGLDQPLHIQYLKYMWGVLHFDFGIPYQSPGETVLELLGRAWIPSLILGGLGVLIGAPIGILLGMVAALRRNSLVDYFASAISTLGLTVPVFVISMLLILLFSVWLNWLPASGWGEPKKWILPIIAYSAIPMATYARYTRSSMLDTLNKPFVMVLRAKGLSENRIIFRHVLRNSAIPMVTVFPSLDNVLSTGIGFLLAVFRINRCHPPVGERYYYHALWTVFS